MKTRRNFSRIVALALVLAQVALLMLAIPMTVSADESTNIQIPYTEVDLVVDGKEDIVWSGIEWSENFGKTENFDVITAAYEASIFPQIRYKAFWSEDENGKYLHMLVDVEDTTKHSEACETAETTCAHHTCNDDRGVSPCDREADRVLLLVSEDLAANGELYYIGAEGNDYNARLVEVLRVATAKEKVTVGNFFEAQSVRDDETGYTVECKYTFKADTTTNLSTIQMMARVTDGGADATKCTDAECACKSVAAPSVPMRYSSHIGNTPIRIAPKVWNDRIDNYDLGSKDNPVGTELPVAKDVAGKTVTIDGTLLASEGWALIPFALVDTERVNPTKADAATDKIHAEDFSTIKVSHDDDFLYFYYETKQTTKESLYLLIGFNGAKRDDANAKGNYVELVINTKATATSESGRNETVIDMVYSNVSGVISQYAAGDAIYDNTKVAVVAGTDSTVVELRFPIPEDVKTSRMKGDCEVTLGVWERFTADVNTGLITSEGYTWKGGNNTFTLKKNENKIYNDFLAWLDGTKATTNPDSLKELTVNVLGDDQVAGTGLVTRDFVFTDMLALKYGWDLNTDNTFAGAGFAADTETEELRAFADQWKALPNGDTDLIIVTGGMMDYVKNVVIGENTDEGAETFKGALYKVFSGLRRKYADACIVVMTPYNATLTKEAVAEGEEANTSTMADYVAAMKEMAQLCGVYCFDANDKTVSGIDMTDDTFRATNCVTADDNVNLNLEGMKIVMPKFEAFLKTSVEDWAANSETIKATVEAWEEEKDAAELPPETDESTDDNTVTTDKKDDETDDKKDDNKKGGCGSTVSSTTIVAVLAILACAAVACIKFRKRIED